MKVCILTPEFLPAWGGVGTYAYNLARGLQDRAEVHVLTGAAAPPRVDEDLEGVQVHPAFPGGNSRHEVSPFRFQAAVFRRLPRLARRYGFDIVHANHAYMSDLLVRLRRRSAATVVTVHTTLETQVGGTARASPAAPRDSLEGRIARWRLLLETVERHYLRGTPAMIFVAPSMSLALRSTIFFSAISRIWALVTLPATSRPGVFEPLSSLAAFLRK